MEKCVKTTEEYGFRCEYCGFTQAGRNAYENVKYHEDNCTKNPAVISAAKKAVGKMYKTQNNNLYVKVLKFNADSTPDKYIDCLEDEAPLLRPAYQKYPLIVEEIDFTWWGSFKDWKKGLGLPMNITFRLRASAMFNFENMIEITQEEWNEALNRIVKESQL